MAIHLRCGHLTALCELHIGIFRLVWLALSGAATSEGEADGGGRGEQGEGRGRAMTPEVLFDMTRFWTSVAVSAAGATLLASAVLWWVVSIFCFVSCSFFCSLRICILHLGLVPVGGMRCSWFQRLVLYQYVPVCASYVRTLTSDITFIFGADARLASASYDSKVSCDHGLIKKDATNSSR